MNRQSAYKAWQLKRSAHYRVIKHSVNTYMLECAPFLSSEQLLYVPRTP
jgi:hypothetical protein